MRRGYDSIMAGLAAIEALPAEIYRRQARRLRASFANDVPQLQNALHRLARHEDASQPAGSRSARAAGRHVKVTRAIQPLAHRIGGAFDYFTSQVEAEVDGGILCYSRRLALLRLAELLKIDRFQASLMIASVQHTRESTGKTHTFRSTPRSGAFGIQLAKVLTFLLTQAAIAVVAWRMFHG